MSRRYAVAEHVPSSTGGWAARVADFIALDCWTSEGCPIHGHEVKVSRGDWLKELKDPGKAEVWKRHCDFWWLVVPDLTVAKVAELPEGWGLMTLREDPLNDRMILRAHKRGPRLVPEPMSKTMIASLARTVAATTTRVNSSHMRLYEELEDFA
jgi:hypothetical protein